MGLPLGTLSASRRIPHGSGPAAAGGGWRVILKLPRGLALATFGEESASKRRRGRVRRDGGNSEAEGRGLVQVQVQVWVTRREGLSWQEGPREWVGAQDQGGC